MSLSSLHAQRVVSLIARFEAGHYESWVMERVPVDDQATVEALLGGLSSPEWRAVLACSEALGRATACLERVVPALIGLLDHGEASIRHRAAEGLGRLGTAADAGVPRLVARLADEPDSCVLQSVLRALGRIGGHGALVAPPLQRLLLAAQRTPDAAQAMQLAWRSKASLGAHPLRQGPFRDGYDLVADAATALGAFPLQAASSLPLLSKLLALDLPGLRPRVVEALGRLGGLDPALIGRLIALVQASPRPSELDALITALMPYTQHHERLLLGLLSVPDLPRMALDDPRPCLVRFLAGAGPSRELLGRLREALYDERPFVRERAVRLLGACGEDAGKWASRLAERLRDADPEVQLAAAEVLGQIGPLDPLTRHALAGFERESDDDRRRAIARESLRAVGPPAPLPAGAFDAARRVIAYLPFDGRPGTPLPWDGKLFLPSRRVLAQSDSTAWQTDEDAFGVLVIDPATSSLAHVPLPLTFPIQPTGALGARRHFRLMFEIRGKLLFWLSSPFSDRRGWGNDNFMYLFDPADGQWSRLVAVGPASRPMERPLVPGLEEPTHSYAGGELVLWKDEHGILNIDVDGTPYHLDDWEHAPATVEALACARRAEEEAKRDHWRIDAAGPHIWTLTSPTEERIKLFDVQALLAGLDPRENARPGWLKSAIALTVSGRRILAITVGYPSEAALLLLDLDAATPEA